MLVGLAAVALLGGVLIAISRLMPQQPDQTSQATVTPSVPADASVAATTLPSFPPPPIDTKEIVAEPPPSGEVPNRREGWVQLRQPLTVRYKPYVESAELYTILAGEAAYLTDGPLFGPTAEGWQYVMAPNNGWVQADVEDRDVFRRFSQHALPNVGINALAGGPTGFVALGRNVGHRGVALTSADGAIWRRVPASGGAMGQVAAYGPAGWLIMGSVGASRSTPVIYVWQSVDGIAWNELGSITELGPAAPVGLVASDAGYVLVTEAGHETPRFWFSADGILWTSRPVPIHDAQGGMRITATPVGFYAWTQADPTTTAGPHSSGAFSADGWEWSQADLSAPGEVVDVVADGDRLLGVSRGTANATWQGVVQGQQLHWSIRDREAFPRSAIGRMVSDGRRIVALGWDRGTDAPLWWERDGLAWRRQEMPAAFGGPPHVAAGGPNGIVAVGTRRAGLLVTPLMWRLNGDNWEPEAAPAISQLEAPTREQCGALPRELVELIQMEGSFAAACFGAEPMTLTGWTVGCHSCFLSGSFPEGSGQPPWLAQVPDETTLFLAPVRLGSLGSITAVLDPSLRGAAVPSPFRQVEFTGHFDDPAAQTCRSTPKVFEEDWYGGKAVVIATCRAQFVVTELREIMP